MYHIEKGDYVNKYQHYENNLNMEEVANFAGTIKFTNVV